MIGKLLKWVIRLCLLLVVLAVVLFLFKDTIVSKVVQQRIRSSTGMQAKIGRFHVGMIAPVVTIEEFRLYNTPDFGGSVLLHVPELHIEYDPAAFQSGQLRLKLMRCEVAELNVVRNEAGRTNIVSFLEHARAGAARAAARRGQTRQFGFTGIDTLNLSLGTIRYTDLRDPRLNQQVQVSVEDQVLKNVRSEADLYAVIYLVLLQHGVGFLGNPGTMPEGLLTNPLESFETGVWRLFESFHAPEAR